MNLMRYAARATISKRSIVVAILAIGFALAGCKTATKTRKVTVTVKPYIPPASARARKCLSRKLPPVSAGDAAKWNRTARARNVCGRAVLRQYDDVRRRYSRKRRVRKGDK